MVSNVKIATTPAADPDPAKKKKSLLSKSGFWFLVFLGATIILSNVPDALMPELRYVREWGKIPIKYKDTWQETVLHVVDLAIVAVFIGMVISFISWVVSVVGRLRRRSD
jgi:hypothetical protein